MSDTSSKFTERFITPLCTLLGIIAPAAASIQNSVSYIQNTNPLESAVIVPQPVYPSETAVTQQEIYTRTVDQVRPIGDWSTYDYLGAPTISRKAFIQTYVDMVHHWQNMQVMYMTCVYVWVWILTGTLLLLYRKHLLVQYLVQIIE